jgi:hypothetical protein
MNPQLAPVLAVFKQQWAEIANHYPVNNNDGALIFRAIVELLNHSKHPKSAAPETSLAEQIEQIAASFPEPLASLYRQLANACLNAS